MMNIKLALLSSLIMITVISSASADDLKFCDSVLLQDTNWAENFTIPKFDPDMGTLKAVDIVFGVNLSQQVKAENLRKGNSSITTAIEPVLVLILPDAQEIKANTSLATSRDLAPFDGVNDFSGPSGINFTEFSSSGTVNYTSREVSGFLAASPGEMLKLQGVLESTERVVASSGVGSDIRIVSGAWVCVSYQYDVAANKGGDKE